MAEKNGDGPKKDKKYDPDERLRYIGFEIETGKLGDHFKSEAEKEFWVKRILQKRAKGFKLRDETSFDKPRVAGYEKIVLTITSLMLIVSLFMPWFSGYKEYEVEVAAEAPALEMENAAAVTEEFELKPDSVSADTTTVIAAVSESDAETDVLATTGDIAEDAGDGTAESEPAEIEKDEQGFTSISGVIKRKEYRKEYYSTSAIGALGMLGMVFSSGIVLKITALLFIIYLLFCLVMAGMILYTLYGFKGSNDELALKLKGLMKYGWIPLGIWFVSFILSFFGASYSFDTTGMIRQLGTSYGIGTYLGLLGYGFYISLGCFVMSAAKAVEI